MTEQEKLREAVEKLAGWNDAPLRHNYTSAQLTAWLHVVLDAARSTLPKTKMVEVWRVEWAGEDGLPRITARHLKYDAEWLEESLRNSGRKCIRVTGPHMQEVPA